MQLTPYALDIRINHDYGKTMNYGNQVELSTAYGTCGKVVVFALILFDFLSENKLQKNLFWYDKPMRGMTEKF